MTELADYTDWLKRTVATPGDFDTFYPNTQDSDLEGVLMDGFSEAQLDGFLLSPTLYVGDDEEGTVTPDLSRPQLALVVLYAAARFMTAALLNRKNKVKYAAKGLEYETEQSASVIAALLKETNARKANILVLQQTGDGGTAFYMADAYLARAVSLPVELSVAADPFSAPFVG